MLRMSPRSYTLSRTLIRPAGFVHPPAWQAGWQSTGSSVATACIPCTRCGLKLVKVALFIDYIEMTRFFKETAVAMWRCQDSREGKICGIYLCDSDWAKRLGFSPSVCMQSVVLYTVVILITPYSCVYLLRWYHVTNATRDRHVLIVCIGTLSCRQLLTSVSHHWLYTDR